MYMMVRCTRVMYSKIYRVWRLECEKSVAEFKEVLITAEQQSLFLYVSINLKFQAKFCIDVQQQHTGNTIIM